MNPASTQAPPPANLDGDGELKVHGVGDDGVKGLSRRQLQEARRGRQPQPRLLRRPGPPLAARSRRPRGECPASAPPSTARAAAYACGGSVVVTSPPFSSTIHRLPNAAARCGLSLCAVAALQNSSRTFRPMSCRPRPKPKHARRGYIAPAMTASHEEATIPWRRGPRAVRGPRATCAHRRSASAPCQRAWSWAPGSSTRPPRNCRRPASVLVFPQRSPCTRERTEVVAPTNGKRSSTTKARTVSANRAKTVGALPATSASTARRTTSGCCCGAPPLSPSSPPSSSAWPGSASFLTRSCNRLAPVVVRRAQRQWAFPPAPASPGAFVPRQRWQTAPAPRSGGPTRGRPAWPPPRCP